jgi:hypothetical protein
MLLDGDLVLSLGAGNVHEQLARLAAELVIAEKLKEIVGPKVRSDCRNRSQNTPPCGLADRRSFGSNRETEEALAKLIRFLPARESAPFCHRSRLEFACPRRRHSGRRRAPERWRVR